ncbi:MAG: zinc ribbon domain-containing protein [Erysipelotrichaceae bacterium]|nr:zinc ribbon domain-containing protein [Erysipelotrichaceae bacterium]
MKCRQCGEEISDDSIYCKNCGARQNEVVQNPLFEKIKKYYNHISDNLNKKNIQMMHVLLIGIIILGIAIITIHLNTLSTEEKYALTMAERYQDMLKDPDSMILRSDVIIIEGTEDSNDYHTYCLFVASGTNSFNASVQSLVAFRDNEYIDDLDEDLDYSDFDSTSEYKAYLYTKKAYYAYQIWGEDISSGDEDCISCDIVEGKKISRKLNIDYNK